MENENNSMQIDLKSGLGFYHRLLFPKPSSLPQNFTRGTGPLAGLAQTRAQKHPKRFQLSSLPGFEPDAPRIAAPGLPGPKS